METDKKLSQPKHKTPKAVWNASIIRYLLSCATTNC